MIGGVISVTKARCAVVQYFIFSTILDLTPLDGSEYGFSRDLVDLRPPLTAQAEGVQLSGASIHSTANPARA